MASSNKTVVIECEFCKKSFDPATILRHIGQTIACKLHYGPRFLEMKRKKVKEKKQKWRRVHGKEKELSRLNQTVLFYQFCSYLIYRIFVRELSLLSRALSRE